MATSGSDCSGSLLFFIFDLQRFLTLEYLQASRESFAATYAESPLTISLIYFLIYVASTALSVPGAVVLTLAGGALFGLGWGLVLVSFASSLGATLAMMASRFVLRDAVQNRFGSQLQRINEGVEKQGAFYLFTLRLVPVVPFCDQPWDGTDSDWCVDFLLGEPSGHVRRNNRLCECWHSTRSTGEASPGLLRQDC